MAWSWLLQSLSCILRPAIAADKVADFTCGICFETMPLTEKFKSKKNECSHPLRFCNGCIGKYIAAKVEDKEARVLCPAEGCGRVLDPVGCRARLPEPVFCRWCHLLCEMTVLAIPRAHCPDPDCNELVLDECRAKPTRVECPRCKGEFCFQCKKRHTGHTCEGEPYTTEDMQFEQVATRKKWRRCPHCKQCVERVDGCHIIRCRCGKYFCYNCGANLKGNNVFHICKLTTMAYIFH